MRKPNRKTLVLALLLLMGAVPAAANDTVFVPSGSYVPFFPRTAAKGAAAEPSVQVPGFWLDRYPVTNRQFLAFVKRQASWRKARVKAVFADARYLRRWPSDLSWGDAAQAEASVTNVSWFAAEAYCEARGQSLPTTDQWEYALADGGRNQAAVQAQTFAWYGTPNASSLPPVTAATENGFGVYGLVGLIWEWTLDFNNAMAGPDTRDGGSKNSGLFCGGGSLEAKDKTDYAAFMRIAMRTGLLASYTTDNLGFRCATEEKP